MGNYNDAKCRLCRRQGQKLFLKGSKCDSPKCPIERRGYPPGEMGRNRYRLSDYGIHLREKQKVKQFYGLRETQFRRYFEEAQRLEGNTGKNLLVMLERRLDNIVYRAKFGISRPQARQFINHEHIYVNGEKSTIPSALLSPGDVVTPADHDTSEQLVSDSLDQARRNRLPTWLNRDEENLETTVENIPTREEVPEWIDELMVVEFLAQ